MPELHGFYPRTYGLSGAVDGNSYPEGAVIA
jgi:hypothetical protein